MLGQSRLGLDEQAQLFAALKVHSGDEDHHEEAVELLRGLQKRPDLTVAVSKELEVFFQAEDSTASMLAVSKAPESVARMEDLPFVHMYTMITGAEPLPLDKQRRFVDQLVPLLNEGDADSRGLAMTMLKRIRARLEVSQAVASDIDRALEIRPT
jgi:hypothetical protein